MWCVCGVCACVVCVRACVSACVCMFIANNFINFLRLRIFYLNLLQSLSVPSLAKVAVHQLRDIDTS